jgi:hypothetical protein
MAAARDRAFLVEEQDRFLSSMLEDHEHRSSGSATRPAKRRFA